MGAADADKGGGRAPDVVYICGVATVVGLAVAACFLLQRQLRRIAAASDASSVTLPLARTIADLFDAAPDAGAWARTRATLEKTRLRAITLTLYSPTGEVFMDTATPSDGRLPAPPTQRQSELFALLAKQHVKETPAGVRATLFRTCSPRGGERSVTAIGAVATADGQIVAVQACGADV